MAAIHSYLKDDSAFDPEATQAMSAAFEGVCAALSLPHTNVRERKVIATRIIELARRGERNADQLRDRVLRDAGRAPDTSEPARRPGDLTVSGV